MMSELDLAKRFLDVLPPVMHVIRQEVRVAGEGRLTVPQYRILIGIRRGRPSQVSQIADRHGVSRPAMSRMVDGLVRRGLLKRIQDQDDRRQAQLVLTAKGDSQLDEVRSAVLARLATYMEDLGGGDRESLSEALDRIESLFPRDKSDKTLDRDQEASRVASKR